MVDKVQFSEPLFFLNVIGMHPKKNDVFSKIRRFISIFSYFLAMSSSLLELMLNSEGIKTIARASDSLIPQIQVENLVTVDTSNTNILQLVCKMAVLILHRKEIWKLIEQSRLFWDLDCFGQKFRKNFVQPHILLKRFYFLYKILITFTCLQFLVIKIITKSKQPVAISYEESKGLESPYDELYFGLHTTVTLVAINLLNGFDGLFFYIVGYVMTELKMTKIAFGSYKIEPKWNLMERFRIAVKHHSNVLEFVSKFDNIYSAMFLVQHMSCLFGICFGVYLMNKDGFPPTIERASKYFAYILGFILQTFTFCFAGDLLIQSSLEISNEIFYCDWSQNFAYLDTNGKIIVMKRGLKSAKLSIGGFALLDLDSFRLVMKNSFSFFTFMNAVMEKSLKQAD